MPKQAATAVGSFDQVDGAGGVEAVRGKLAG